MNYSYYEVYINALRAFSGMGFPYGADEDAAYIISWLELNNLDGVKLFANSIKKIDKKYNGKNILKKNNFNINLENFSVIMKGPGLIDYFISEVSKNKKIEINIINCSDPLYFIPLLYRASKKILSANLIHLNNHNNKICYVIKNNSIRIGQISNNNIKLKKNQVKIMLTNKVMPFTLKKVLKRITKKSMQRNFSRSLTPNTRHWDILEKIANRSYVPESKESRIKGAGAENDSD